jgi:hypothetical protein
VYRRLQIIFFILASIVEVRVYAKELVDAYVSVRALGMGNAYGPIVKGSNSLFYNPAGISRIEGYNWQLFELYGGLDGEQALAAAQALSANSSDLSSLLGQRLWIGGGGKTSIFTPGFAAAYYTSGYLQLDMTNPALPNMNITVINDMAYALGTGIMLFPGFHVGMVVRRILRSGGNLTFGTDTITNFDPNAVDNLLASRGVGFGADLGLNFTFPAPGSPTLSMVWKNMGQTSFTPENVGGIAPPSIEDQINLGFGVNFESMVFDITPVIEYKYANRYDLQMGQRLHLGVELGLPIFDFRGGFSQGYYTWGIGMDMGLLKFDLATYGVELGEYPGQKEDRRWLFEMTMELGFDPNFNLLGSGSGGSGSRRLKRRR